MRALPLAALAAALLAGSPAAFAEPSAKAQACADEAKDKTERALAKVREHKRWASWSPLDRYAAADAAGAAGRLPSWADLSPEAAAREAQASRLRAADDRALARAYGQEAKAATGASRAAAYERQAFWSAMAAIDSTGSAFASCMARRSKS